MCNNCIHKPVCSKYIAMGEVNSCEHYREDRKGRWKPYGYDVEEYWKCSACGECWFFPYDPTDKDTMVSYCPECGADMRKPENDTKCIENEVSEGKNGECM